MSPPSSRLRRGRLALTLALSQGKRGARGQRKLERRIE